jgi:enterochelin esterase-like enzyme
MAIRAETSTVGVSRRLARFEEDARVAPGEATEQLRAELTAAAGPLVEPLEDSAAGDVLVTFVWIGSDGPVALRAQLPDHPGAYSHSMDRVEGTDVWHLSSVLSRDLRVTYRFVIRDHLVDLDFLRNLNREEAIQLEIEIIPRCFADAQNPDRLPPLQGPDEELASPANWTSVLTLPDAPPDPGLYTPGRAAGELTTQAFHSTVFDNQRAVTVYTPPTASSEEPALLVMLDGEWWLRVGQLPLALDNLHAENLIPRTVAVFVHNATYTSRMVEMACEPRLPTMLADELLPVVRAEHGFAAAPERTIVGGASYGGLASAYAAFRRPDVFGAVLSCSGSYWWGLSNDPSEPFRYGCDGESEWLTRQFAAAERKPVRFWLDVGILERGPLSQAPGIEQLTANRHLRTVLQAKGYEVTYFEARGGHDFATWKLTAPAGLQALLSKHDTADARDA